MSANQIYRQSKLGDSLVEALDQMVMDEKIPGELATRILSEFDEAFLKRMGSKLDNKAMFKGKLDTYRNCDNVWTFIVSDVMFRQTHPAQVGKDVIADRVKIVAIDTRLVNPESNQAT
eukprot:jgi/Botrbrau1/13362/Bobra.0158s0015.1